MSKEPVSWADDLPDDGADEPGWTSLSPAANDVIAERYRQRAIESYSPDMDDDHAEGELSAAAAAYAMSAFRATAVRYCALDPIGFWPWHPSGFKPTNARRDLVKAGALILAEIERLDRAAADAGGGA